ncbi:hypothetical protein [Polaromonas sp.]
MVNSPPAWACWWTTAAWALLREAGLRFEEISLGNGITSRSQ